MPFSEVSKMDQRREFVRLARQEGANISQRCARFGISRTAGYKWLGRYALSGETGLSELSRRPHGSPRCTKPEIEAQVLALRQAHPAWGGRKIAAVLRREQGTAPAASTVTAILRRHGVALDRSDRPSRFQRFEKDRPNALWQMDFKGHVPLRDGGRLHPLTVLDDHSRYALLVAACANERGITVKSWLVNAFRRYGLPERMITDNGAPWGNGPGDRFTPLGVFLIDQGIGISHARPYHPQTMGKDERFHRSLKAEALAGPPFADLGAAAQALAVFRENYNSRRPHEALGLSVPAERYAASPRSYCEAPPAPEYGPDDVVRTVNDGGRVSLFGRTLRVPSAFKACRIAFRPTKDDGVYDIFYRHQLINKVDIRGGKHHPQTVNDVPEQVSTISPV